MKKLVIITIFLFALFPVVAGAQDYEYEVDREYEVEDDSMEVEAERGYYEKEGEPDYDYEVGDMEFTIVGSGSSDKDWDRNAFNTEASLGFYPFEYMTLFFRQSFNLADISGDDDLWAATSRVGFDFVFDLGRLKPFLGGSAGYLYGDDEWVEDQFIAGPEAGLKIFATPSAFIFTLMEYQFLFEDADDADEQFDDGRFVYSLGVGFKF